MGCQALREKEVYEGTREEMFGYFSFHTSMPCQRSFLLRVSLFSLVASFMYKASKMNTWPFFSFLHDTVSTEFKLSLSVIVT